MGHAGSSSGANAEDGGKEQADLVVNDGDVAVGFQVGDEDAGPIAGERITFMSPFERLMLRRMDNFADEQRSHHEFCVARFQNLDEQIEAVQNHLFELQYGKDD